MLHAHGGAALLADSIPPCKVMSPVHAKLDIKEPRPLRKAHLTSRYVCMVSLPGWTTCRETAERPDSSLPLFIVAFVAFLNVPFQPANSQLVWGVGSVWPTLIAFLRISDATCSTAAI